MVLVCPSNRELIPHVLFFYHMKVFLSALNFKNERLSLASK